MDGNDEGTVIGEQVRHARRGKGWSPDELARHAGLDRATVDGVEAGGRRTGVRELTHLARALDVPVDYLLRPRPAVISHRAELLEEESDTEADRSLQRIEVALSSWLRDVRQLVEAGTLRPNPPVTYPQPVTSQAEAREVASWLRERHGAGTAPIESMRDFNERSGQYVLVTELPGEGASLIDGDLAVAVVNTMDQPGRRRSTAAHELGHLVLGDEYSADLAVHQAREEREAMIHAFAAELLLPRQAFGQGEASVFAAAEEHGGIAVTDDGRATRVGRRYGLAVHGTVWLLAQACRNGKLTETNASALIEALRATGHRLPCTGTNFVRRHGLL